MKIGFDVISDLYLTPEDSFDWEGKATSLYCIVAGNVSNDLKTIRKTLTHLGRHYQGVFYCLGSLEYEGCVDIDARTAELSRMCNSQRNVALLHNHVVIVESVALLGINGWGTNATSPDMIKEIELEVNRNEDIVYLQSSLERLQRHLDVKHIVVASSAVPNEKLYFGQEPDHVHSQLTLDIALTADTENKVTHWVYGTYDKVVDITDDNINYINNSCYKQKPYWAKRIEV